MAPVTKDFGQVTTLIELYLMFNLLEFDIDNIFSHFGKAICVLYAFHARL